MSALAHLEDAQVVWVEGDKVPLMVQKTDGGFGYGTTDMAALRQRVQDERGEWLIYVVDEGQAGHFRRALKPASHKNLPVDRQAAMRVLWAWTRQEMSCGREVGFSPTSSHAMHACE